MPSKSLTTSRVFTERDFKKADQLDRIFMAMMFPRQFTLSPSDSRHEENLRQVYSIVCEEVSDHKCRVLISNAFPDLSPYRINKLIMDCKRLYGEFTLRNREFDRNVLREKFIKLAQKAEEEGNITEARRNYQAISKMFGYDGDHVEGLSPEDIELPDINFTNHPNAFFEDAEIVEDSEEE